MSPDDILEQSDFPEATRNLTRDPVRTEEMLFLRLPDRFVPCRGEEAERAIGVIADCVREIGAGSLFVSWRHDPHCDHEASYQVINLGHAEPPSLSSSDDDARPPPLAP
jgi:hypothetical protein